MGWSSGSELAEEVWMTVRKYIPAAKRETVARNIICLFEDMDCDTLYEAEQLCHDAGIEEEE